MLRNRRTVIFTLVLPAALFFVITGSDNTWDDPVGIGNEAAYILISMALYGAALDRRRRRLDGRDGARARLVAPAPADPAQPGRLHPDQGRWSP